MAPDLAWDPTKSPVLRKSNCSEAALSKKIDAHDGIRRPITHCLVRST
jgi:hypothetical protein